MDEVALLARAIRQNAELASLHITCESIGGAHNTCLRTRRFRMKKGEECCRATERHNVKHGKK